MHKRTKKAEASLLREEGRSVICRLILIDPAQLNDSEGPPAGMQFLRLTGERTFRENEIRRLSPSATLYRSLIGIRWDPDKGFLLWGIIMPRCSTANFKGTDFTSSKPTG